MNERHVIFEDLGQMDYKNAWELQELRHASLVAQNDESRTPHGYLLFVEHPHVYTLGLHGDRNNLLIDPEFLNRINATYYHVNRGGDITYHGPGQLVGYPVIDIKRFSKGVKDYVFRLEESIIQTLKHYHLSARRLEKATGVWLDQEGRAPKKICAIGIRASRGFSMHGFAFNINTQLEYFNWINPCGFTDKGVTSLQQELGYTVDQQEVKTLLREALTDVFGMELFVAEQIPKA